MTAAGSSSFPARRAGAIGVVVALAVFVGVGVAGVRRYGINYWRYRGFDPPRDAAYVKEQGTTMRLEVASAALGGRRQEVYVYLPPGYATSGRRYPVVYLLHGFPGRPLAFLETVRMGVVEDELVALGKAQPLILVMPFGSSGTFTDEEWANGVRRDDHWETFVARDVVGAIDGRFRTVTGPGGRAVAGLSEGGFGAINIALHHPHEFSVVESWSGYERPDPLRPIYGAKLQLLARNDPLVNLPRVARRLHSAYFWLYSGTTDRLRGQNATFAQELARGRVAHRFFLSYGGHNWALWRKNARAAYLAAAARLSRA